jgi:hypothetical protein
VDAQQDIVGSIRRLHRVGGVLGRLGSRRCSGELVRCQREWRAGRREGDVEDSRAAFISDQLVSSGTDERGTYVCVGRLHIA